MNPDLSQLKDIHLPDPISWWPPAPGWWGLLFLCLLLVATGVWLYRRHQANRWRRFALHECAQLKQLLKDTPDQTSVQQPVAQQISALLRRVALTRYPRDEVASLSGQDWINFLTQSINNNTELPAETVRTLLHAPYSQHSEGDLSPLLNFAEHWIKALPETIRRVKSDD